MLPAAPGEAGRPCWAKAGVLATQKATAAKLAIRIDRFILPSLLFRGLWLAGIKGKPWATVALLVSGLVSAKYKHRLVGNLSGLNTPLGWVEHRSRVVTSYRGEFWVWEVRSSLK